MGENAAVCEDGFELGLLQSPRHRGPVLRVVETLYVIPFEVLCVLSVFRYVFCLEKIRVCGRSKVLVLFLDPLEVKFIKSSLVVSSEPWCPRIY